jgi:non-ribosomal peptide synthetase component F/acyl carrier protein
MYTSGSTGWPKGVPVTHRNVVRLVKNTNFIELTARTCILQTGAPVFDATTFEIWGSLLNGGQLVLTGKEVVLDARQLGKALKRFAVNTLWLSAPLFNQLLENDIRMFSSLDYLLVGGDALSPSHINRVGEAFPGLVVINGYGPTENTTFSATYRIGGDFEHNIPIGRPIANSTAYIIDRNDRLQPIGVSGELLVGGDGVACGYINNPELTAGRFFYRSYRTYRTYIPGKLYRTGDLARWLVDGNIEFSGRMDHQVKIRGFRVELTEIENQLLKIPGIKEAVVTAVDERKSLCAYIVLSSAEKEPDAGVIKGELSTRLPDYMIPAYFVSMERIPLTPNGKVDYKALPEPEAGISDVYVPPRNEQEERLAVVWAGVLNIEKEKIGIDDDFFELGGHSLKATMLVARIHREMEVNVPLTRVFTNPTIRGLSRYIKDLSLEQYTFIEPVELKEYYPLSSAQKRLYVLQQMEPGNTNYNMPFVVPLGEEADKEVLEETFRKLVARHEMLRTSFQMVGEMPVQRVHRRVDFTVEEYSGLDLEQGQINIERFFENFRRPFDLSVPPLLRAVLIKADGKNRLLVMDMHHIVTDGTSQDILKNEFAGLFRGEQLPVLKLQCKDFSVWQNGRQQQEAVRQQEAYWLREFSGEVSALELPTDNPRPVVQSFAGRHVSFIFDGEETVILKAIAREHDVTLFMVLLAVFNLLFSKLSGQEDIILGTPIAARRHVDLQPIVGMLVNTLVMRNYPSAEKTVGQFLQEVKQRTLAAYENQEYPFEDLVNKLSLRRDTGRHPLFDVMLNLLNQSEYSGEIPEIPGGDFYIFGGRKATSRFDMAYSAVDMEEIIYFSLEYSTTLFSGAAIERLVRYLKHIVRQLPAKIAGKLADIEIIAAEEKESILGISGGVEETYEGEQTIHQLFEGQVSRHVDEIAVVGPGEGTGFKPLMGSAYPSHRQYMHISYGELNRRANQLAHLLRSRGVGPDTVVGIMVERSIEMMVGLLGIMKAGGAYLPIDSEYPENRILAMVRDSGVPLILSKTHLLGRVPITALKDFQPHDEGLVVTPRRSHIKEFDPLPYPDRTLVNYQKYHQYIGLAMAKHTVSLMATRGCPYNCAFCHKIWPKAHVIRSAENITEEMRRCYQAGARRFTFIDDVFNLDRENSGRLFRLIKTQFPDVQLFFPNGLRGDILTKDFIDLMVEAGTVNICIALESASPRIQSLIRKRLNLEKFKENARYIAETYPHVVLEIEFMVGFPTESEEEALMTLDFIKDIRWVHFPNLNILKIYPNTDMYDLAVENGVSKEAIERSVNLAFHELPETLPFSKSFMRQYQTRFMNEYFLRKERLLHVLPRQMKNFSADEIVQKYDSYLPVEIKRFSDLLQLAEISTAELGEVEFLPEETGSAPGFETEMARYFPVKKESAGSLRVLLLDLSLLFSRESADALYDMVEEPLGLMYLLSYLNETFAGRVQGK